MKRILALLLVMVLAIGFAACGEEAETAETTKAGATTATENSAGETEGTVAGQVQEPVETPDGYKRFSVVVVHKDGKKELFVYNTDQQYLGPVLVAEGLISGNDGPYGLEIVTVDGESAVYNTDGAYWAIYVGEEYAMSGIDGIEIEDNAQYRLEYTVG